MDGSAKCMRVSVTEFENGYVLVCSDETALRHAARNLRTVVNTLQEGVVVGNLEPGALQGFVSRIRRVLSEPIEIMGGTIQVGGSIGVVRNDEADSRDAATPVISRGSRKRGPDRRSYRDRCRSGTRRSGSSTLELPAAVFRESCIERRKVAYRLWTSARQVSRHMGGAPR